MIATALTITLLSVSAVSSTKNQQEYNEAANVLVQMAYKEIGVETYLKNMEQRYISEELKKNTPVVLSLTVARIAAEKRIVYSWSF